MRCGTSNCSEDAYCCFRWPGQSLIAACLPHALKAWAVAEALGFVLDARPLGVLEEKLAAAVLHQLTHSVLLPEEEPC